MDTGKQNKTILIVDEHGFARICSAILTADGYRTDVVADMADFSVKLAPDTVGLVVTSYPFGSVVFDLLRTKDIPSIILLDGIDERLMQMLNNLQNSCCMIKPIDYGKFKHIVAQALDGKPLNGGGYSIV